MKFDLPFSTELIHIIMGILLDDLINLLLHLVTGMVIGIVISLLIYRLINAKGWFKRSYTSRTRRIFLFTLRVSFYVAIVGLSSTIALVVGSNKIAKKEVNQLVDEGFEYCKINYFNDYEFIEEVFEVSDKLYSSGNNVNQINHEMAEAMVNDISEKYGLGFLGAYLLKSPESEMIEHLEDIEKGIIFLFVYKGLEQIGAGDLIEPDQLDETFYSWLHSDGEQSFGSIHEFVSKQINNQVKPLIFSIWLPLLIINALLIGINIVELTLFFYRKRVKIADER
ncbi:MAG: hypothetical protein ACI9JN_000618 [Bacteroidia bacterium]|jgi:hypothetical protein